MHCVTIATTAFLFLRREEGVSLSLIAPPTTGGAQLEQQKGILGAVVFT